MKTKYKEIRVSKFRGEKRYSCRLANGFYAGEFMYFESKFHFHNYGFGVCRLSPELVTKAVVIWTEIADFLKQLNKGGYRNDSIHET
jgi:hypothetical protein